jgi:hypothetical protein
MGWITTSGAFSPSVLLDRSQSMGQPGGSAHESRLQEVVRTLESSGRLWDALRIANRTKNTTVALKATKSLISFMNSLPKDLHHIEFNAQMSSGRLDSGEESAYIC